MQNETIPRFLSPETFDVCLIRFALSSSKRLSLFLFPPTEIRWLFMSSRFYQAQSDPELTRPVQFSFSGALRENPMTCLRVFPDV